MSKFKIKSLGLLTALSLLPSPKAVAQDTWSAGAKVAASISYAEPMQRDKEVKVHCFNPWFGGAIYSEYAFNDHVGAGVELLYNRFTCSGAKEKSRAFRVTGVIGTSITVIWRWSSFFVRPGFKEHYFLARSFFGIYPFYCLQDKFIEKYTDGNEGKTTLNYPHGSDYKFGFIAGLSFELPNGLLVELKGIFPYNLYDIERFKDRYSILSFHVSLGYNFAKLAEN